MASGRSVYKVSDRLELRDPYVTLSVRAKVYNLCEEWKAYVDEFHE
jgi:hypothetical protein